MSSEIRRGVEFTAAAALLTGIAAWGFNHTSLAKKTMRVSAPTFRDGCIFGALSGLTKYIIEAVTRKVTEELEEKNYIDANSYFGTESYLGLAILVGTLFITLKSDLMIADFAKKQFGAKVRSEFVHLSFLASVPSVLAYRGFNKDNY